MKTSARALLALVLSVGGVLAVTGGPATAAPAAYAAPVAGTVLTSTSATLPPELAAIATGRRISYVTTDINGVTITATGLVITPTSGRTNKTVAWGHGTTGLADQCAPSTNQDVFWPEARDAVVALLQHGWTVAAPDYPGIGTPQEHPYLVGGSEARSLIDSVKAARNLDPALSTDYAIDGHSQGGQGSLWANQMATSYDGNLVLKGTAAIAPVSNLDVLAPYIPGSAEQGYLPMALFGIHAVEPTFDPNTVLTAQAAQLEPVLSTGCLYEIMDAYAPLTADQLVQGGTIPDAVLAKLAKYGNPAQTPPTAPILIVQGTDDEAVPYDITADYLLPELGTTEPVDFVSIQGATHDSSVVDSTATVANWIAARFA